MFICSPLTVPYVPSTGLKEGFSPSFSLLFPLRGASPFQHSALGGTDSTRSCDHLYLPLVIEFLLQVLVFMDHLIPMFLSAISLPSTSSFVLESMKSLVKGCEAITK